MDLTREDCLIIERNIFLIFGIVLGAVILITILGICGVLDNKVDRLDLDEDLLAKYHVLQYYPEYENCSVRYLDADEIACEWGVSGTKVFCKDIEDRDGMSVLGTTEDLTICFDEIEMNDILDNLLEEYR